MNSKSYRTLPMMSFLVAISSKATEPLFTSITTLLPLQKQKIHGTKKAQPQRLQWDRLHLEKRMLKQENTPLPSEGNLSPCDPKDEKVAFQSLFNLFLVARSLSATFHTDVISNFKSVIQKPLTSFVQVSPK